MLPTQTVGRPEAFVTVPIAEYRSANSGRADLLAEQGHLIPGTLVDQSNAYPIEVTLISPYLGLLAAGVLSTFFAC